MSIDDNIEPPNNVHSMHNDDEFTKAALTSENATGSRWNQWISSLLRKAFGHRLALRILLIVSTCALLVITFLTSSGITGRLWREARFAWLEHSAPLLSRTTITPQRSDQRTLSGWERQPFLSPPNSDVRWYTPAPNHPQTYFACSASQIDPHGYQEIGPLTFWRTNDAGKHWMSGRIPHTQATSCSVSIAPDDDKHLGLMSQQSSSCSPVAAFVSTDGGEHWRAVPSLPAAPEQGRSCNVFMWPTMRHLYLFYYFEVSSGPPQNRVTIPNSSLARSDDGGRTWEQLDDNRPPESDGNYPMLLNDGETLIVSVYHDKPAAKGMPFYEETQLWVSHDAGDSWEPLGIVQGYDALKILLAPGGRTAMPSLTHPLYLLNEAYPSSLRFRIQIVQVSDLHHWAPLPPLPIAGATPEHLGITTVLTETASGELLVFGLGPDDRVPADDGQLSSLPAQQWLWEWNPQTSRWSLLTPSLASPWPKGCSEGCWSAWLALGQNLEGMDSYLWVRRPSDDGQVTIFSVLLSDSP